MRRRAVLALLSTEPRCRMALGTFLAGCLLGALAATFLTHAEQHSLGSDSIPLSLSDAFAQIQSGWTRPTQARSCA